MNDTKSRIARNLDAQFAEMGFAAPGVDALRDGADVSLRTLYKYFPSREAMVVGALEYRNEIYLDWISGGPDAGRIISCMCSNGLAPGWKTAQTMAVCS